MWRVIGAAVLIAAMGCEAGSDYEPPGEIQGALLQVADHEGANLSPACVDNYTEWTRTPGEVDVVVIHTVQGTYSGAISWFGNCSAEVSAHYVVSHSGQITQCLAEADIGWHAGDWDTNVRSIGIEHAGYVDDPQNYTEAMMKASAELTADIAFRHGITPSRWQLIGHDEVPGCPNPGGGGAGCHTDPGEFWDWDDYLQRVESHLAVLELGGEAGEGTPVEGGESDTSGEEDLLIPGPARILGWVQDGAGGVKGGVAVALDEVVAALTSEDGFYLLEEVPPGHHVVQAMGGTPGRAAVEVLVVAGQDHWVDLLWTPTRERAGTEGTPRGAPAAQGRPSGGEALADGDASSSEGAGCRTGPNGGGEGPWGFLALGLLMCRMQLQGRTSLSFRD